MWAKPTFQVKSLETLPAQLHRDASLLHQAWRVLGGLVFWSSAPFGHLWPPWHTSQHSNEAKTRNRRGRWKIHVTNTHICMSFLLPLGLQKWKTQPLHPNEGHQAAAFHGVFSFAVKGFSSHLAFIAFGFAMVPATLRRGLSYRLKHALGCVRLRQVSKLWGSLGNPICSQVDWILSNHIKAFQAQSIAFAGSWTILSILVSNRIIRTCTCRRESCNTFPSAAMRLYWKRRILPFWSFASQMGQQLDFWIFLGCRLHQGHMGCAHRTTRLAFHAGLNPARHHEVRNPMKPSYR